MTAPRPLSVRIAAGAAAAALALGLPVVIALLTVTGERWRGLLSTVLVALIVVPVVFWFLLNRKRPAPDGQSAEPDQP